MKSTKHKLFMVLLGCKPEGRHTEQHDIFFGIAESIAALKADIIGFWPEANGAIHIDAWREVTYVDGYHIKIVPAGQDSAMNRKKLFFINLGGYRKEEFDELHYKMLIVADELSEATRKAKETTFYKHMGFEGAVSHIDDKYGVDVDDAFLISDVLPSVVKNEFHVEVEAVIAVSADVMHLGYLPLSKV